ncbi:hypothetical protein OCU04_006500 [Sclerotinia nivalis]|uniref:Uncharacterized protein n=1 Tax=Sclerotinia nivalis TaxID=352851 RepID=A0A9X0AJW6_9HELO|nr:hypothetical protein OCU04_006500 [Sclerotinia nivalis]
MCCIDDTLCRRRILAMIEMRQMIVLKVLIVLKAFWEDNGLILKEMRCPKLIVFVRDENVSNGKSNLKILSKLLCSEYLHGSKGARAECFTHIPYSIFRIVFLGAFLCM